MRWPAKLRLRLRSLFFRRLVDRDLDDELGFHLEHLIAQNLAAGLTPVEARRRALIEMGGPGRGRDDIRETRGLEALDAAVRDLRFAARSLRHSRGFAASAITSLSLGLTLLGATSAIGDAYLIRSMPARDADRLFHVWYSGAPGQVEPRRLGTLDWGALSHVIDLADSSIFARYYTSDAGFTEELVGLQVPEQSLDALGISVVAGRALQRQDFERGAQDVLIGDRFWRTRFGGDHAAIGRTFSVTTASQGSAATFRIAGVLPAGFRYVREYSRSEIDVVSPYRDRGTVSMVRLRQGISPSSAAQEISTLIRATPEIVLTPEWPGVRLESVHDRYVAPIRPLLTTAWLAASFVLLIVAANLAILALLRGLRRQREVSVRLALGAGWSHLVRGVLAESAILCGIALAISLTLTTWIVSGLMPRIETSLGRVVPGGDAGGALGWFVAGLVAAGAGVVILVILLTTMVALRRHMAIGLRSHARAGGDGPVVRWARAGLVSLQIGGSIALLVGCGLMVRTAMGLLGVDLGITTTGVVRTRVALPAGGDQGHEARLSFYDRLTAIITDRPGTQIAFANWPLFVEPARVQEVEYSGEAMVSTRSAVTAVSAGYTEVLGIPVLEGRGFGSGDRVGSAPVALVSTSLARRLWPAGHAVGQRLRTADRAQAGEPVGPWRLVVGVVGDVRQTPMDSDLADVYVPFFQVPLQFASVMIRSTDTPSIWLQTMREALGRIDPHVLAGVPTSLDVERDRLLAGRRLLAWMLSGFAAFATFLTVLGVYGVTAHAARQRESEVALRLALGATPRQVSRLFFAETSRVVGAGIAVGVVGAGLVGRVLKSQLHQLSSFDPATVGATMAVMSMAALVAAWVPVRRVARQSPARVLQDS